MPASLVSILKVATLVAVVVSLPSSRVAAAAFSWSFTLPLLLV